MGDIPPKAARVRFYGSTPWDCSLQRLGVTTGDHHSICTVLMVRQDALHFDVVSIPVTNQTLWWLGMPDILGWLGSNTGKHTKTRPQGVFYSN
ncbi:MAG TPA: hypothetical protein V6D19_18450 [Stenomitos sp.]